MSDIINEALCDWFEVAPVPPGPTIDAESFWRRATSGEGCWTWQEGVSGGYGRIYGRGYGVPTTLAHRVAWVLAGNADPGELCVLHSCDNPPCIRPDHLFLGTRADNSADMMKKGRHRLSMDPQFFTKGTSNARAKLTNEQVVEIRQQAIAGEHYTAIAKAFGISPTHACGIINGRSWRHIWPYFEERSSLPRNPVVPLRRRRAKTS
jgi:hypothetical protein